MARPLQKKKNKSSLHRATQKPKSKRINIKSNPIVAANWDQKLTLSQNYRRLGLSSKLNPRTGGTEKKAQEASTPSRNDSLSIPSSRAPTTLGTAAVKVTRDPKSGAIISVEHTESEKRARENPLDDPLNDIEASDEDEVGQETRRNGQGIVADLEESAKYGKKKRPRMQSQREREWVERLVDRWGDDWVGMVRDRKLNPQQQSEGDLKRRVGLWKATRRRGEGHGEDEDVELEA